MAPPTQEAQGLGGPCRRGAGEAPASRWSLADTERAASEDEDGPRHEPFAGLVARHRALVIPGDSTRRFVHLEDLLPGLPRPRLRSNASRPPSPAALPPRDPRKLANCSSRVRSRAYAGVPRHDREQLRPGGSAAAPSWRLASALPAQSVEHEDYQAVNGRFGRQVCGGGKRVQAVARELGTRYIVPD